MSRSQEDLDGLKKEIDCEIIVADLADEKQARDAAEKAGDVHFLVNNAGTAINESFLDTSVENFLTTFNVNVTSVLIFSQVVAKKMISRGEGGSIVNVSSQVRSSR